MRLSLLVLVCMVLCACGLRETVQVASQQPTSSSYPPPAYLPPEPAYPPAPDATATLQTYPTRTPPLPTSTPAASATPTIPPPLPDGLPEPPAAREAFPQAIADFLNAKPTNRDRVVDLIVAWGVRTYQPDQHSLPGDVVVEADLDGDGRSETVVVTPAGQLVVLARDEQGRYEPSVFDLQNDDARLAAVQDINRDGLRELIIRGSDNSQQEERTRFERFHVLAWTSSGFRNLLAEGGDEGLRIRIVCCGEGFAYQIIQTTDDPLPQLLVSSGTQRLRWDGTLYRPVSGEWMYQPTPTYAPPPPSPPTGSLIYLAADGTTVMRMAPDGSNTESLFRITLPVTQSVMFMQASPTGQHIVYALGQPQVDRLDAYLADLNGVTTALTTSNWPIRQWSADGRWLSGYLADGTLYRYDLVAGMMERWPIQGFQAWLPDNVRLLAIRDGQVFRHNVATGSIEQLTDFHVDRLGIDQQEARKNTGRYSRMYAQYIAMAPSGQAYLFGIHRPEIFGNGGFNWDVGLLSDERGLPTWISSGIPGTYHLTFSPNSSLLLAASYWHVSAFCSSADLSVHSLRPRAGYVTAIPLPQTSGDQNLDGEFRGLSWSPTSSSVAFAFQPYVCEREETPTLFPTHIYTSDVNMSDPAASAEPRRIAEGSWPTWVP